MNAMLQIIIGLVAALWILGAGLQKKKGRGLLLALTICMAVALFAGCGADDAQASDQPDPKRSVELMYALAVEDPQYAQELLDEAMGSYVYDPELTLFQARLYAMQGNYTPAKLLYEKAIAEGLDSKTVENEYELAVRCTQASHIDQALLEHNSSYVDEQTQQLLDQLNQAKADLAEAVAEACQDCVADMPEAVEEGAQAIIQADRLYEAYLSGDVGDEELLQKALTQLRTLERRCPDVFAQSYPRIARMKLRLIQEDFDGIAKDISAESGYKELMVVSELYINGHVSAKDFSKGYASSDLDQYEAVLEQLELVYADSFSDESASLRRQVKKFIGDLQYQIDNPSIAKVQEQLEDYAKQHYAADGSKVYLQLSKLAQDRGNEGVADNYLAGAMNTAGNCTDKDYTDPMFQIIDVINDKQNTEALKNVNTYVEQVLDNSTTVQLHAVVQTPAMDTEPAPDQEEKESFDTYFSDHVSKKRTSINIINVDSSDFSKVILDVSVDSNIALTPAGLKEQLKLIDCGAEITEFTVEDITLSRTNIILVCDTSGSMDGMPIESLRTAVSMFVNDKTEKEHIGLVTFHSYVDQVYGLESTVEELNAAVGNIYANGGTNMYDAVIHAISMLEADADAMNIVILMSDGFDNYYHSVSEFENNIIAPCLDKEILLYSIGLGSSVDSEYLNRFSEGTKGEYLYASDPQTLKGFYDHLHNLIANRYRITYKAVDTMTRDRTARVEILSDELAYDESNYYLLDESGPEQPVMDGKTIHGLQTRLLYKSDTAQTVLLQTTGFTKDDKLLVTVKDKLSYQLTCKYKNENGFELTIPSNIAVGEYDLIVSAGDGTAYFANELVIGAEDYVTTVGSYIFTSCIKEKTQNSTYLTGYVRMNGWLTFKGPITLTGDLENGASVQMKDQNGSYIQYNTENAQGLAKYLAQKNKEVHIPALGNYTLYCDIFNSAESDSYKVDMVPLPVAYVSNVFTLAAPGISLYPNAVRYDIQGFDTKLPFQDKLLKESGYKKIFSFDWEGKVYFTNKSVDLDAEFSLKNGSKQENGANLGNMPLKLNLAELEVKVNTLKNEYAFAFKTKLPCLDADSVGLDLTWNNSLVPETVKISCDTDITANFGGVPVTFSDFMVGLSDIDTKEPVYNWTLEGSMKVSAYKVSALLPKLEKFIGDASVISISEAKLKLCLGRGYINLAAKVKVLDAIELGAMELEMGRFDYKNQLLDMNTEVTGIRAKQEKGITWKTNNCNIEMTGSRELCLTNKYLGIMTEGVNSIEVHWWIFKKSHDIRGQGLVGMYKDHYNRTVFTVRARSTDVNKKKGVNIYWIPGQEFEIDTRFY